MNDPLVSSLESRWSARCRSIGRDGGDEWHRILAGYSAPDRHYHNLAHIGDCLQQLDAALDQAQDPVSLEFAIWYHDLIYDTHAADNEARSAEAAEAFLADEPIAPAVTALILATRHDREAPTADARLLCDIDLSVLGRPPGQYDLYAQAIRTEYAWVAEEDFARGRKQVLQRFLARDHIFTTPDFRSRYERPAVGNLLRELRQWEQG